MLFVGMVNYAFDTCSLKDFGAIFLYGGVGEGFEERNGFFVAWKNWDLEHGGFEDESGVLILFAEERFCDFLIVRISLEDKGVEIASFVEYP